MGMTAVVDPRAASPAFSPTAICAAASGACATSALPITEVMTRKPRTIHAERLAIDCVELMETAPKVTQLLVVDAQQRLVGALHLHDLFRAKVV